MKITIATPFYPPETGVLSLYSSELEAAFKRAGHEVEVVTIGHVKRYPAVIRHVVFFIKILAALRGTTFVLALDTWSVGFPACLAARITGVRCLIRVGGDFLWESYVARTHEPVRLSEFYARSRTLTAKEKIIRAGMRMITRSAVLLFNSKFQRDIWQKAYDIPAERTRLLENFYPEKRTQEDMPSQNRVFVSAGRDTALKNYAALERVFARLKEAYPKIDLDMRSLPRDQHLARVRDCYAVIIPSVSEVSSNSAIDAVYAGKPFIMTEDTGTKERLGECGLFIDTRTDEALEKAVVRLLNPDDYEYFRARIKEFSFSRTWDEIATDIVRAV